MLLSGARSGLWSIRRHDRADHRRQGASPPICGRRVAAGRRGIPATDGPRSPVSPSCWSARTRRAPSMSGRRARRRSRREWRASSTSCRRHDERGRAARLVDRLNARRQRSTASSSSFRCRSRSIPSRVIAAIDPAKDVDGFHPVNAGRLSIGPRQRSSPARRSAASYLLKQELGDLAGKDAVVVGRSNIVGKPMAQLLLGESATVTVAHSQTRDLARRGSRARTSSLRRSAARK